MRITQKLALGSVLVSVVVLGLKIYAARLTGSVALLADALASIVNLASALAAVWALHVAEQPADDRHPYGHTKAEYLSAVAEGVLIVGAAGVILWQAYRAASAPSALTEPALGLAVNLFGTTLSALWCVALQRRGRALGSSALQASGKRLRNDVLTSLGVVIGMALVYATGRLVLDPVIAALVALNVLWGGWHLMKQSVGGLMDEAPSNKTLARIREIIACNAEGAIEAHDIKSRCAGKLTFIEFHLVVDGGMIVSEAHDICDRLERVLKAEVPDTAVTIHVEPDQKRKHSGIVVL